jgi:hypothetical protein
MMGRCCNTHYLGGKLTGQCNYIVMIVHVAGSIQLSPGIQSFLEWVTILIGIVQVLNQTKITKNLTFSGQLL